MPALEEFERMAAALTDDDRGDPVQPWYLAWGVVAKRSARPLHTRPHGKEEARGGRWIDREIGALLARLVAEPDARRASAIARGIADLLYPGPKPRDAKGIPRKAKAQAVGTAKGRGK
jgi:hypothetical protein